MEKAKQMLVLVILCGVALYFLPTAMNVFGISAQAGSRTGVIALSSDGGKTFSAAALHANYNVNVNRIVRSRTNPQFYFAATDKGLFLSKDGGNNWYAYSGLEGTLNSGVFVYDIVVNPQVPSEVYVAASEGGRGFVYVTRDNFFTLSKIYDDTAIPRALAVGNGAVYFSMSDGRVVGYFPSTREFAFQSSDTGHIFSGLAAVSYMNADYSGSALAAVAPPRTKITAATESGPLVFFGSQSKLYRSADYGTHWTISQPIDGSRSISFVHVFPDGIVLVGSKSGFSLTY